MKLNWTNYGTFKYAEIEMTEGVISIVEEDGDPIMYIGYARPFKETIGNLYQVKCHKDEFDETLEIFLRELGMGLKVVPVNE